jgi:hypothetical protein
MTDLRKAAEMALEALEGIKKYVTDDGAMPENWDAYHEKEYYALEALRQALAQPEQEPEAWMGITDNPYCDDADCNDPNGQAMRWHKKLLYLRKQEYTAPSSKPWVSLTDDEIHEAAIKCVKSGQSINAAIRAIEAKLKEKNT